MNFETDSAQFQLHKFCDASNSAFCCVVYLRCIFDDRVEVKFIFGKSRLVLTHQNNWVISRKEIQSAKMCAEVMLLAQNSFSHIDSSIHFWTDSKVVLGWITNSVSGQLPEWTQSRKTQSRRTQSRMDTIPNGHNPEWTQSRMDTIPNGHHPERTPSRKDTIPNGHNPEWVQSRKTQSRMDTIPNGHNPEWTQSQMDTIPKGHNPEWTQSRKDTIPNEHLQLYCYFGV